jgi:hypothetical protein
MRQCLQPDCGRLFPTAPQNKLHHLSRGAPDTAGAQIKNNQREHDLSGNKPATFVGLQRGTYGIPFNVNTTSEAPFADDLETAVSTVLTQRGFTVIDASSSSDRKIQLRDPAIKATLETP